MRKAQAIARAPDPPALQRPARLPADARLVLRRRDRHSLRGEAMLGARRVARLIWSRDGRLLHEQPLDARGRPHGVEIERDDDGAAVWCATWVRGSMHGPAIQFDERGVPLLVTHFVRGRGADLWMDCGRINEVRELLDGVPHGLVRWGDPRRPWEEGHFVRGRRHGVFREWDPGGRLLKGFPRFYVDDARVSRRAYEGASAGDPSLRPYLAREDRNVRTVPAAVREAVARARALRRELALVDHARRRGASGAAGG